MNKIKPSYNKDRLILGEALPLDTPFTVILDSSEKCNFKCYYCFRSTQRIDKWGYASDDSIMSMETFKRTVAQMLEFPLQIKRIALSNHGEPLYNINLSKMIKYVKEMGLTGETDIHTNASLLNPDMAVDLAASGIDKVVVSVQGIDAKSYLMNSGRTIDFNLFCMNLELLYKNKHVDTVINIKTVDTALKDNTDVERFFNIFTGLADRVYIENVVPLYSQTDHSCIKGDKNYNKYGSVFQTVECCPQVFYTLVVSPNGDIYPCAQIPPPVNLGNIYSTTLLESWNGSIREGFLHKHLEETRQSQEYCGCCYVPQNSVKTDHDIIDAYRDIILLRMQNDK